MCWSLKGVAIRAGRPSLTRALARDTLSSKDQNETLKKSAAFSDLVFTRFIVSELSTSMSYSSTARCGSCQEVARRHDDSALVPVFAAPLRLDTQSCNDPPFPFTHRIRKHF